MKKVLCLIFLTCTIFSQYNNNNNPPLIYSWPPFLTATNTNNIDDPLVLSFPNTPDSTVPPSAYDTTGYFWFRGKDIMLLGQSQFWNLPYSITDTFYIEIEFAMPPVAQRKIDIIAGNGISNGTWSIDWFLSASHRFSFNLFQLTGGGTVVIDTFTSTNPDTTFHTLIVAGKKSDSTIYCSISGNPTVQKYTSRTWGTYTTAYDVMAIGCRGEFRSDATYGNCNTCATFGLRNWLGKIRRFVYSRNDSAYTYQLSHPGFIYPEFRINGVLQGVPYYPYEYADRRFQDVISDTTTQKIAGTKVMINGWDANRDTVEAVFYQGSLKPTFVNCYPLLANDVSKYNGITAPHVEVFTLSNVWINRILYIGGYMNYANDTSQVWGNGDTLAFIGYLDTTVTPYKWQQLGHGFNNGVVEICNYNDTAIVAGGTFTTAIGYGSIARVAYWSIASQKWFAMSTGANSDVDACANAYGVIAIGGAFTTAGGKTCNRFAIWNGTSFDSVGAGLDATVLKIRPYIWNGERGFLVAGYQSNFTQGGTTTTCRGLTFASYDSLKWKAFYNVQCGVGEDIKEIIQDTATNWFYIGGKFSTIGGTSVSALCRYKIGVGLQAITGTNGQNGVSSPASNGFDITSICIDNNKLYLGGEFTRICGYLSRNLAAIDLGTRQIINMQHTPDMRIEGIVAAPIALQDLISIAGDQYYTTFLGRCHTFYQPSLNP